MKKITLIILIILLFIGGSLFRKEQSWTKYQLIAHAGGGIDNHTYTNSKEAFLNSYKKGFKVFEFDLSLTSDGKMVARHEWKDAYGQIQDHNGSALTYKMFMNHPYYNKYTPIDFNMVIEFMKKHPDIYVILDGKVKSPEDTQELYETIGKLTTKIDDNVKKRIIPQMFYKEDLKTIRQYGFQELLYVVGRESYTPNSLAEFCNTNNINAVSLSKSRTNQTLINTLSDRNIKVYMYTLNNKKKMKKYSEQGVDGFFTDFVTPEEFHKK